LRVNKPKKKGKRTIEFGRESGKAAQHQLFIVQPEHWDAEADWRFKLDPIDSALKEAATRPVEIHFRESSLKAKDVNNLREFRVKIDPGQTKATVKKNMAEAMRAVIKKPGLIEKIFKRIGLMQEDAFTQDLSGTLGVFSDDPEREFLQTMGGPYAKSLNLAYFLQQQAECFWELHHNPLAKAGVQVKNDFVVGRGVKFKAKDPQFQEVYDEWNDRDNGHDRLKQSDHDLTFQGELMWRVHGLGEGRVTVRLIDPSTIWEVIANPEDGEEIFGYWQIYQGAINIQTMIVDGKPVPTSVYKISVIPADEVVRVITNVAAGEKRGRSDFFPALAWFRRARRFMSAKSISAEYENAFAWDVELAGTQGDVDTFKADPANMVSPKPGSAWVHNSAVKVTPMSAKAGSRGGTSADIMLDLVRWIAATLGIPHEYLGWGDASTKAQAITATQPWAKRISNTQLLLETALLKKFVAKMHAVAKLHGLVGKKSTPEGEWTWPEPAPEDVDARLSRLAFLKDTGVIDPEKFATMAAAEANITEYDYAATKVLVDKAREEAAVNGMASLYDKAQQKAAGLATSNAMGPADRAKQNQTDTTLDLKPGAGAPPSDDSGDETA